MSAVSYLSRISQGMLRERLRECCGSERWVERVAAERPFDDDEQLLERGAQIWWELGPEDWRQAFAHHVRIRAQPSGIWLHDDDARAASDSAELREALTQADRRYEKQFGHGFVVFTKEKTLEEVLRSLEERLGNDLETELKVSAEEQFEITRSKLLQLSENNEPAAAGAVGPQDKARA